MTTGENYMNPVTMSANDPFTKLSKLGIPTSNLCSHLCKLQTVLPGLPKHMENANKDISMGESNTVASAYTMYRHLQQYCSHPSI